MHGTQGARGTPDLTVLSADPGHTTSHLLVSPQLRCSTTGGEVGRSGKSTQGPLGVPCKLLPRLGFGVCEWSLSPPAQVPCPGIDFDSSLPVARGLTTGHLSSALTLTASILCWLLSQLLRTLCWPQRGPWDPPENLHSATEGSIRQHPRQ